MTLRVNVPRVRGVGSGSGRVCVVQRPRLARGVECTVVVEILPDIHISGPHPAAGELAEVQPTRKLSRLRS